METARESAEKIFWRLMEPDIYKLDNIIEEKAIRAIMKHDAEIRKECADRAVAWAKKWAEFPMGNHGDGALRAAIIREE